MIDKTANDVFKEETAKSIVDSIHRFCKGVFIEEQYRLTHDDFDGNDPDHPVSCLRAQQQEQLARIIKTMILK